MSATTKTRTRVLWTIQTLVAALFLFAGVMKLITPVEVLAQQAHMSGGFLRFIGVAETLGALGLILPGVFRIHRELTALAAIGLTIIMAGAVTLTAAGGAIGAAVVPAVVGALLVAIAYHRWEAVTLSALRIRSLQLAPRRTH